MKNKLRKILLEFPGFQSCCRLLTRRHIRVIMYHRFAAPDDSPSDFPNQELLRRQMHMILRHHAVWRPDDQLSVLRGERWPGGNCPVIVTVDDGYWDFYDYAFPVFRELAIPAMLFVTTGFVDGDLWLWWDRLWFILQNARVEKRVLVLDGERFDVDTTGADGCKRTWNDIADRCRFLPNERKERILDRLADELRVTVPQHPTPGYGAVSWDQIEEMSRAGVLYGAHSVNHPILTRVSTAEATAEITQSRYRLAEKTGGEISWFCYPQGGPADVSDTIQEQVRNAGFVGSYLAYQELERPLNRYALSRYGITADHQHFRWVLCGAEYIVARIRRLLGLPTGLGPSYWSGAD